MQMRLDTLEDMLGRLVAGRIHSDMLPAAVDPLIVNTALPLPTSGALVHMPPARTLDGLVVCE